MTYRAASGAARRVSAHSRAFFGLLFVLTAFLAAGSIGLSGSAAAQPVAAPSAPAAQPAPVSADELEHLVRTLQDENQRTKLVHELRGLIAAQRGIEVQNPGPTSFFAELSSRFNAVSGDIVAAAAVVVDAPRLLSWIRFQVTEPVARAFWLEVALKLSIIFGFALFSEWLLRTLLQRPRQRLGGN